MFRSLNGGVRLHGQTGAVLWGSQTAARVRGWTVRRNPQQPGKWLLAATLEWVHPFNVRQRALIFAPPRHQGFWCFPIESIDVGVTQLVARLGPPEQ